MSRYQYYEYTNPEGIHTIACVTTYAGKTVKGIAKCDPRDEYSRKQGRELALARCDEKVAGRRMRRAKRKFEEAQKAYEESLRYLHDMCAYYGDSVAKYNEAMLKTNEVLKNI